MNNDPISAKERRKARAMVRDISRQVEFHGQKLDADEWWTLIFACIYGQEVIANPFSQQNPNAPTFVIRNKKRTKDLTVTTGAELITQLYAFGAERGVEWSDPEWISMREQDEKDARRK